MARALVNANVLPMTTPEARASAILWVDDEIVAVGADEEITEAARAHGIDAEDAGGRVVLPGFVDAHTHFVHVGVKHTRADLRGTVDLTAALARVTEWVGTHDGPIIAEGWDEAEWPAPAPPTRGQLDAIDDQRPIVMRRICGHKAVANTPALALLRPHWNDDRVDLETGMLVEEPSLYLNEVISEPNDRLAAAVAASCSIAHRLGITAVGEYCQAPYRTALLDAAAAGALTVRVSSSIYTQQLDDELAAGFKTGRPAPGPDGPSVWMQDGGLKVFLDGSLGGHTALLREPYTDEPTGPLARGRANWTAAEVRAWFAKAHAAGVQIHAHAIGDAAIDLGLDAFAATFPSPTDGAKALRHRFEHYEIVHDDQVARTAELGIVASSQPNFVGTWSGPGGMYETRLGPRYTLNNRFVTFRNAGIPVAFGSDGMPFGPLRGLDAAIRHPVPAERLSPTEAVWHYTHQAAWSLHLEDVGSLTAGKKADLLILQQRELDGDPLSWVIAETISGGVTRARQTEPFSADA